METRLKKLLTTNIYAKNFPLIAEIYRKKERYDIAEKICLKGIEKKPNSYKAYNVLGRIYLDQGKFQKAVESFEKSLYLEPKNWYSLRHLGHIYIHLKNVPQALKIYKTINLFYPDFKEAENILHKLENIHQERYTQFSAQHLSQIADDLNQEEFLQRPCISPSRKPKKDPIHPIHQTLNEINQPPRPLSSFPKTSDYIKNKKIARLKKLIDRLSPSR